MSNFYDFKYTSIEGKDVSLSEYKGKAVLVVNVASKCGFTPQYKGLQALYDKYKDQGFEIIGFPCNQFGHQESGSNDEIHEFCEMRFGVNFPLSEKVDVNGSNAHPLYKYLKDKLPGALGFVGVSAIKWNFTKFLISKTGEPLERYAPNTEPENIAGDIEAALK